MKTLAFSDLIMSTKLNAPRVGVNLLERPRLWEILKQYTSRNLTLITAPAGYGKTMLISQFSTRTTAPTAWYHLDKYDNDLVLFIQHLLAGLDRFLPGVITDMLHLVKQHPNPNGETRRITSALINSLEDRLEEELILAIDDYHEIRENAVHNFMEQLLHYLPENMHIIMTSRTRPPMNLERLRVAGLLEEIELQELRFSREEIADFLMNESNKPVSNETVTFLEEITEGWPAALRLAGIAMLNSRESHKPEKSEFLPNRKEIFHYLAEEVLRHMPDDLSDFVLSTSVLDLITPQICDLLLEREDSRQVLEKIDSQNLFITTLEGEYQAYRYHPLFKEFLLSQLPEKKKKALFENGGKSYLQAGFPSHAIECFLRAGNYVQALSAIEISGNKMLLYNRWQTIQRWLKKIPVNLKKSRPRILLLEGVIHLNRGQLNQAETLINEAALSLSESSDREGEFQAKLCQGRILRSQGKYEKSMEMLEHIFPNLPRLPVVEWYDVTLEHSLILLMQGRLTKAWHLLNPALNIAEQEGELHIASWLAERLVMLYFFKGSYHRAVELHQRATEMAPEQDRLSFSLRDSMAAIYHDWGDLDQALDYIQNSIAVKEKLGMEEALPYAYSQMAFILGSMNRPETAEENFLYSIELARKMEGEKFFLALSMAYYSRFMADQGRLEEALSIGNEAVEISRTQSDFIYAICIQMIAPAYIKGGELQKGADMLQEALEILEHIEARYFIFQGKAYLGEVYRQQSHREPAEELAGACLKLAASEDYLQFFLSYPALMKPVIRYGLIKGEELDFVFEIIKRWGKEAEELLLELSSHDDAGVRERIVTAMTFITGEETIRALQNFLYDSHEKVRNHALSALAKLQKVPEGKMTENNENGDKTGTSHLPDRETILKIQCLGPFRVFIDDREVTWRTTKARDLCAYLFYYRGKPVHKEKILEALWPDSSIDRSSTLFHTNMYQLRQAIKTGPGNQPVKHQKKQYSLDQNMLSSDVDIFVSLAASVEEGDESPTGEIAKLEEAVSLYRGEYMEEIDYYWVSAERERINQMYLNLMDRLAHLYFDNQEFERAASCLRTILQHNPLLENTHALLMRVYAGMGDRMAVMQQYNTLCRALEQEMGIDPSPKTRDLYYELCSE